MYDFVLKCLFCTVKRRTCGLLTRLYHWWGGSSCLQLYNASGFSSTYLCNYIYFLAACFNHNPTLVPGYHIYITPVHVFSQRNFIKYMTSTLHTRVTYPKSWVSVNFKPEIENNISINRQGTQNRLSRSHTVHSHCADSWVNLFYATSPQQITQM